MTWQDVAALAVVLGGLALYLHYIVRVYPERCIDACEKDYYTCYDITQVEHDGDGKFIITRHLGPHEEHDPGDEQPKK